LAETSEPSVSPGYTITGGVRTVGGKSGKKWGGTSVTPKRGEGRVGGSAIKVFFLNMEKGGGGGGKNGGGGSTHFWSNTYYFSNGKGRK